MGKVLTEVRSAQRSLIPDAEEWESYQLPSLRGIARKAKQELAHRFRDLSRCLDKSHLSHGYRPRRGARQAADDLAVRLQFGRCGYVVEADIKGFFNHIDHDILLDMIAQRVDDKRFIRLIAKWLRPVF